MAIYIFGYGSLINRTSAGRTLKRTIEPSALILSRITGYRRGWTLKEQVFYEQSKASIQAVFLDIEPDTDSGLNGVLIAISDEELGRLKLREKNYNLIDITHQVRIDDGPSLGPNDQVVTFVAMEDFKVGANSQNVFVMQRYIDLIETGCRSLGADFLELYRKTTEPVPFPILDGAYRFVDPAQAQSVESKPSS